MSIKEKMDEIKEAREAKKYFNENNDAVPSVVEYLKGGIAGLILAIIGGYLIMQITQMTGYYIGYAFVGVGYLVGYGSKKLANNKGNIYLGVIAALTYLVGVIVGILLFQINYFGIDSSFIDLAFIMGVLETAIFNEVFVMIMVAVGGFVAFGFAKE